MTTLPPTAEEFLSTLNREAKTIRTYRNALTQFFAIIGDADLTTESYITFLRTLKRHSTSTQKVYSTAVRRLYKFARVGNETEMEEATDHYTESASPTLVNFNIEAVETFLDYARTLNKDLWDLRDRAAVFCYVGSGFRLEELTARKVGDIDFVNKRTLIKGKKRKHAVLMLSNQAIEYLNAYLAARRTIETRRPISSQPLFAAHDIRASKRVEPITGSGLRESIKRHIEEAGIDRHDIRIHDLRHYFITMIYQGTKDPILAQQAGRHSSLQMTGRYAHLVPGQLESAYDKIINGKE